MFRTLTLRDEKKFMPRPQDGILVPRLAVLCHGCDWSWHSRGSLIPGKFVLWKRRDRNVVQLYAPAVTCLPPPGSFQFFRRAPPDMKPYDSSTFVQTSNAINLDDKSCGTIFYLNCWFIVRSHDRETLLTSFGIKWGRGLINVWLDLQ